MNGQKKTAEHLECGSFSATLGAFTLIVHGNLVVQSPDFGAQCVLHAELLQSCPTVCDHMDCSLPGSSVPGISQARILEWVAMPSSRGSSQLRAQTFVS